MQEEMILLFTLLFTLLLLLLPENLRSLRKHSGRVLPINNVHPLKAKLIEPQKKILK